MYRPPQCVSVSVVHNWPHILLHRAKMSGLNLHDVMLQQPTSRNKIAMYQMAEKCIFAAKNHFFGYVRLS